MDISDITQVKEIFYTMECMKTIGFISYALSLMPWMTWLLLSSHDQFVGIQTVGLWMKRVRGCVRLDLDKPRFWILSKLLHEMEINFGIRADQQLRDHMANVGAKILLKCKGQPLARIFQEAVDNEIEETRKQGLVKSAGILLLPTLFNERVDLLYTVNKDPVAISPTITLHDCPNGDALKPQRIAILLDGSEAVKDDKDQDIVSAVACLFALYYVYNLEYPKRIKNTLIYLEKFCYGLEFSGKTPVTVLRVHNDLDA